MGSRRLAREATLQVLYQLDMLKEPPEEAVDLYFAHFASPESSRPFAEFVVQGVHNHLGEIDELMRREAICGMPDAIIIRAWYTRPGSSTPWCT